jgi:putative transposase
MRLQALKGRPRRRRLPPDRGERQVAAVAGNVLGRSFEAVAPSKSVRWWPSETLEFLFER